MERWLSDFVTTSSSLLDHLNHFQQSKAVDPDYSFSWCTTLARNVDNYANVITGGKVFLSSVAPSLVGRADSTKSSLKTAVASLRCSKCNKFTMLEGVKFCTMCGHRGDSPASFARPPSKPTCPKCRTTTPEGAMFCTQCGTKLNTSGQRHATPSSPFSSGAATKGKMTRAEMRTAVAGLQKEVQSACTKKREPTKSTPTKGNGSTSGGGVTSNQSKPYTHKSNSSIAGNGSRSKMKVKVGKGTSTVTSSQKSPKGTGGVRGSLSPLSPRSGESKLSDFRHKASAMTKKAIKQLEVVDKEGSRGSPSQQHSHFSSKKARATGAETSTTANGRTPETGSAASAFGTKLRRVNGDVTSPKVNRNADASANEAREAEQLYSNMRSNLKRAPVARPEDTPPVEDPALQEQFTASSPSSLSTVNYGTSPTRRTTPHISEMPNNRATKSSDALMRSPPSRNGTTVAGGNRRSGALPSDSSEKKKETCGSHKKKKIGLRAKTIKKKLKTIRAEVKSASETSGDDSSQRDAAKSSSPPSSQTTRHSSAVDPSEDSPGKKIWQETGGWKAKRFRDPEEAERHLQEVQKHNAQNTPLHKQIQSLPNEARRHSIEQKYRGSGFADRPKQRNISRGGGDYTASGSASPLPVTPSPPAINNPGVNCHRDAPTTGAVPSAFYPMSSSSDSAPPSRPPETTKPAVSPSSRSVLVSSAPPVHNNNNIGAPHRQAYDNQRGHSPSQSQVHSGTPPTRGAVSKGNRLSIALQALRLPLKDVDSVAYYMQTDATPPSPHFGGGDGFPHTARPTRARPTQGRGRGGMTHYTGEGGASPSRRGTRAGARGGGPQLRKAASSVTPGYRKAPRHQQHKHYQHDDGGSGGGYHAAVHSEAGFAPSLQGTGNHHMTQGGRGSEEPGHRSKVTRESIMASSAMMLEVQKKLDEGNKARRANTSAVSPRVPSTTGLAATPRGATVTTRDTVTAVQHQPLEHSDVPLEYSSPDDTGAVVVTQGTPAALIYHLLASAHPEGLDVKDYESGFFKSIKLFIDPMKVFSELVYVYEKSPHRRERIVDILNTWVDITPEHFEEEPLLRGRFDSFVATVAKEESAAPSQQSVKRDLATTLWSVIVKLEHSLSAQRALLRVYDERCSGDGVLPGNPFDVYGLQVIAEQISIQYHSVLWQIQTGKELKNEVWNKHPEQAPNVVKLIQHFNNFSFWLQSMIVSIGETKERTQMIISTLRLGRHLLHLKNYHGVMAVLSALNSAAIQRLKHSWSLLKTSKWRIFDNLSGIFDPSGNLIHYREALQRARPPGVPYLGVMLNDLTIFSEVSDTVKTRIEGKDIERVNFAKMYSVGCMLDTMKKFQRQPYTEIQVIPEFQAYLDSPVKLEDEDAPARPALPGEKLNYFGKMLIFSEDVIYQKSLALEARGSYHGEVRKHNFAKFKTKRK